MPAGIVFIDGEYMRPEDATMSIFDAGFVWGDGVYDVTSAWNGWFFMIQSVYWSERAAGWHGVRVGDILAC